MNVRAELMKDAEAGEKLREGGAKSNSDPVALGSRHGWHNACVGGWDLGFCRMKRHRAAAE